MRQIRSKTKRVLGISGIVMAPFVGGGVVGLYAYETAISAERTQSTLRTELAELDGDVMKIGDAIISYSLRLPEQCIESLECADFPEAPVVLNSLNNDLAEMSERRDAIPAEIDQSENENIIKPDEVRGYAAGGIVLGLVASGAGIYAMLRSKNPRTNLPKRV